MSKSKFGLSLTVALCCSFVAVGQAEVPATAPAMKPEGAATQATTRAVTVNVPDPWRFRKVIESFAAADAKKMPEAGGIVVTGSSTAGMWDLKKAFPGLPVLNRGIGGTQLSDNIFFVDRMVLRYRPRLVVLYVGSNDIDSGKPPAWVAANFRRWVDVVQTALPGTRIIYVSIKPSPSVDNQPAGAEANALIAAAAAELGVRYVDPNPMILDKDGKTRPELYRSDRLHFNDDGYAILNSVMEPVVREEWEKIVK